MIRVKMTTTDPRIPIARQTPGSFGVWGECQFLINKDVDECDWWVVLENLPKEETTRCPKENTVLVMGETAETKIYNPKFLNQFGKIITCQRNIPHPNPIYYEQGQSWMVGHMGSKSGIDPKDFHKHFIPYDALKAITHFKKNKLLSVFSSGKNRTAGQIRRLAFIELLKKRFGAGVDVFGVNEVFVKDKWDGIAEYKYHLVLENSVCDDYFTEKLSDAFLGGAYPIYYGCPNIYDYFSKDALTTIDIAKPEEAFEIIERTIKNDTYEKNNNAIMDARNLILDKYNIFAVLARICSGGNSQEIKDNVRLIPEDIPKPAQQKISSYFKKYPIIYGLFRLIFRKYRQYL